jgi:hypothetical protein
MLRQLILVVRPFFVTKPLHTSLLTRYWFPTSNGIGLGIGVTAYSIDEANRLAARALPFLPEGAVLGAPIENVNINNLDQGHVIPNMGACNFHGVWFPLGVK